MGETIKGINVSIGSDTTGLAAALSDVNKHARNIQSELKQVEKLLKLDPANTELVAQKQKLLGDAAGNTREKLDRLRAAAEQVNAQFAKGEISEGQYRAFQREVAKTEQELRSLESRLQSTENEFKDQSKAVSKLGKDYKEAFDEASRSMGNSFDKMKTAGAGITAAGAGIALGLGSAVSKAADFEQSMSNVKSVMSPADIQRFGGELEKLAIQMGSDTKYSATEAARGIEELVKAGVSTEQIMGGGLAGALSLATAGELELADAAEIASTALNAFRDDNLSVQKAADILAGAANASATSVSELKFGLSAVSAVASSVGLSFEDTTTALAAFAQNGLKGSDAGTSLKTMLMNLQPSTKAQVREFESLGLVTFDTQKALEFLSSKGIKSVSNSVDGVGDALRQYVLQMSGAKKWTSELDGELAMLERQIGFTSSAFYDQNGSIKSISDISAILKDRMSGMTDAQRLMSMEIMFGSDAIRAANILYKEGADGIQRMNTAMGEVTAAQVAAERMNNLKGSIEELSGAAETAQISVGNALVPAIKVLVGVISSVTDAFNGMSPAMQSTVAIIGAVVAALALIAGPLLVLIGFLPQIAAGLAMLGITAASAGAAFTALMGPLGIAIAAIIAATVLIIKNWEPIKGFFSELWASVVSVVTSAWEKIKAIFSGVWSVIGGYVTAGFEVIKTYFTTAFQVYKTIVQTAWDVIKTYFTAAFQTLKTIVSGAWEAIKTIYSAAFLTIYYLVTGQWDKIGGVFSAAGQKLKSIVSDMTDRIKGIWSGAWDSMSSSVSGGWERIKDAISDGLAALRSAFGDFKDEAVGMGKNIILGLISGIKSMASSVAAEAKNVVAGAVQAAKDFLLVRSPSRKMMEIGEYTGEGLAIGIGRTIGDVSRQAERLAAAAVPSIDTPGYGAGAGYGTTNHYDMRGLLEGAVFHVRSDNDIKAVARELAGYTTAASRGRGVVLPG